MPGTALQRHTSLVAYINVALVAVTTVILFGFGGYNYASFTAMAQAELAQEADVVAKRLAKGLVQPLWNLDAKQIKETLMTEVGAKTVAGLLVKDANSAKPIEGVGRDSAWGVIETKDAPAAEGAITATADVLRQGKKIAVLEVFISTKFLQEARKDFLVTTGATIVIVDVAIVLILYLVIRSLLIIPLKTIQRYAAQVGGGDLTCAQMQGKFKGELGGLKNSLELMVCNLTAQIDQVRQKSDEATASMHQAEESRAVAEDAKDRAEKAKAEGMRSAAETLQEIVERLTSASDEINAQVVEVKDSIMHQKMRMHETRTAMDQMNEAVLDVARNAGSTSTQAETTKSKATAGSKVVEEAIKSIGAVQGQARTLSENMNQLGKQAEGIGRIINVIEDIADQTNLLALNAAIEAARAGEAGRGFAVVADEVRKLAEKTMNATKEVGQAIREIQDVTRKNLASTEAAGRAVDEATTLAGSSGEALREIVGLVNLTSDSIRAIAAAAEEQSATSEIINKTMAEVDNVSDTIAEGMSQASQGVAELASQTFLVKRVVDDLREGHISDTPRRR